MRTLAALLFVGTLSSAQSPDTRSCSVDGTVVNSATGTPIPRVYVSVTNSEDNTVLQSDAAGRWSVEHIACGRATISATRVGFLKSQKAPALNPSVTLADATPLHDIKLELSPQAVIAGRVLDDQGDPIQGALVSLMTSRVLNGARTLAATMSSATNDLGEYRFAGLEAGKYLVCAASGQLGMPGGNIPRPPVGERCYPGPLDSTPAVTMDVAPGFEGRVDFTLMPVQTAEVRGVVSGVPDGVNGTVSLVSRALPNMTGRMGANLAAAVRKDGTFIVRNVPPGAYMLIANALQQNRRLMARTPVDVGGGDVDGIHVHLEPGVTVAGTVKVVSIAGRKLDRPQFTAMLRSTDSGGSQIVWDESRTSFAMPDVLPGNYRLDFSAPAPFYVRSATMGGRDILGQELPIGPGAGSIEVVVSDDGGVLEGDVTAEGEDGPVAAWVLVQKDGAQPRNVRTDSSGHFRMDTIPPGDYKVYAWDNNVNVEYANADWMQRYGKGVAVTIRPGPNEKVKLVRQTAPSE